MNPSSDIFVAIIISAIICVVILLRELLCWYFKINERNSLLRDNNTLLKRIIKQQETLNPALEGLFDESPNKEIQMSDDNGNIDRID